MAAQPDVVAELGDAQYDRGAVTELPAYDATWGRLWDRTTPYRAVYSTDRLARARIIDAGAVQRR